MAIITVVCQGDKWQADFEPLIPRLERFFTKAFRSWGRDREEFSRNALLLFMVRFSRKWKAGETISLTTNFVMHDVSMGKVFLRRPNQPSVRARSLTGRLKARMTRADARLDYRLMLERLDAKERRVVEMAVSGYSVNEIRKELRCQWGTVKSVLRKALALLQA